MHLESLITVIELRVRLEVEKFIHMVKRRDREINILLLPPSNAVNNMTNKCLARFFPLANDIFHYSMILLKCQKQGAFLTWVSLQLKECSLYPWYKVKVFYALEMEKHFISFNRYLTKGEPYQNVHLPKKNKQMYGKHFLVCSQLVVTEMCK